jgi:pimeloyl-ACP methyl ester carboxylesterase
MDGFLILHGKSSGPAVPDCSVTPLAAKLEAHGRLVDYQAHSWETSRIYSTTFESTTEEIRAGIQRLRARGATRIHLVGHSMGGNIAIYYAVHNTDFDSFIGLATAHNVHHQTLQYVVKWSVEKARGLVAEGNDTPSEFVDWNVTDILARTVRPSCYLSYFDPDGNANMTLNVRRIGRPLNVLMVGGNKDNTQQTTRMSIFDPMPKTPYSQWIQTNDDHNTVSLNAYDEIVKWVDNLPK